MPAESKESTVIQPRVPRIVHLKVCQKQTIWPDWNCDCENTNTSEDHWEADNKSDFELQNGIEAPEFPAHQDGGAEPNVSASIPPRPMSIQQTEQPLMTVTTIETRRNKGCMKV